MIECFNVFESFFVWCNLIEIKKRLHITITLTFQNMIMCYCPNRKTVVVSLCLCACEREKNCRKNGCMFLNLDFPVLLQWYFRWYSYKYRWCWENTCNGKWVFEILIATLRVNAKQYNKWEWKQSKHHNMLGLVYVTVPHMCNVYNKNMYLTIRPSFRSQFIGRLDCFRSGAQNNNNQELTAQHNHTNNFIDCEWLMKRYST